MKSTTDAPPPRPKPNVTRAYKSGVIERGELDPSREDIAAQQRLHLTAIAACGLGVLIGLGIGWFIFAG